MQYFCLYYQKIVVTKNGFYISTSSLYSKYKKDLLAL